MSLSIPSPPLFRERKRAETVDIGPILIETNSHHARKAQTIYSTRAANGNELMARLESEQVSETLEVNHFDTRFEDGYENVVSGPPALSLAFLHSGAGVMGLEEGPELTVRPGQVVVMHTREWARGYNRIAPRCRFRGTDLQFAPSLLERFGIEHLEPLLSGSDRNTCRRTNVLAAMDTTSRLTTLEQDIRCCSLTGPSRRLFLESRALEALSLVLDAGQPVRALAGRERRKIEAAAALMSEAPEEAWTISRLANAVAMSETQLKRGFRAQLKTTVHGYLENARLEAAQALLGRGASVTEVALAVGYASPSHFAAVFRSRFRQTPSAWAREHSCAGAPESVAIDSML
ncbi:MAG: AraC family transcriptional regulator [Pseudomonadota bacterium]